ncbi:ABC transporter permease [Aeromicrobium sp. UC242_57]|uniref:ABC transporter permease n=1 Tax=Aeromicrobium sp. UC242_57 TaxID=3374624 RepID=UPI0037BD9EF1
MVLAWLLTVAWTLVTAGRGPRLRSLGSAGETITAGLPQYWVGILLLIVFAANLGWFPVIGGTSLAGTVLPVVTLAVPLAGFLGQATRTEFDRAIREPFVLSARTRGMGDLEVRWRHVLRHALIPGITLSGWAIGSLLSGAVLVETVFARPGLGAVLVTAVSQKDLAVVAGIVVLISALYVVINLLVDIIYVLVDPDCEVRYDRPAPPHSTGTPRDTSRANRRAGLGHRLRTHRPALPGGRRASRSPVGAQPLDHGSAQRPAGPVAAALARDGRRGP